jgi:hypothetical protein
MLGACEKTKERYNLREEEEEDDDEDEEEGALCKVRAQYLVIYRGRCKTCNLVGLVPYCAISSL